MDKRLNLSFKIIGILAILYVISLFYTTNYNQVVYIKPTKIAPTNATTSLAEVVPPPTPSMATDTIASSTLSTSTTKKPQATTTKTAKAGVSTTKAESVKSNISPVKPKTEMTKPPAQTPTPTETTETVSNPKIATNQTNQTLSGTINQEKPITKKPLSWGVYTGADPTSIENFEKKITANPDYLAYFIHWGNSNGKLPTWLYDYAAAKDRTLVIFWEASDYWVGGTVQPKFSFKSILNGNHDDYINSFAKQIKAYKGPVILIPFSELNGNWNPWSGTTNGNSPEEAVLAFRYVHKFFDNVPNVKFGLALNANSVPDTYENRIEAYYPGPEYVDYIGLDGFNMGQPWDSFSDLFNKPLNTLSKYNKPMFIFSFASAQGKNKSAWLNDALNVQMPKYPLLKGFVYFNQDKERNWLLWSDQETLSVFKDYVSRQSLLLDTNII